MKKIQILNSIATGGKKSITFALVLGLLLGAGVSFATAPLAHADACPSAPNNIGSVTVPINIPSADDYSIWTRMAVPNSKDSYVGLEIDGKTCYAIGGADVTTANNWRWVNMGNVTKTDRHAVKEQLSAGSHTLKYIGASPGVILDRVIATPDGCVPVDKGDNCPAGDDKGPSITITSPTANQSGSGPVKITGTASDTNGIKEVQLLIDGNLRGVDSTSPFSFTWVANNTTNGVHNIQLKAIDKSGNSALSAVVPYTITGGGNFKKGDLNQDGTVNVKDLSAVLRNWGKPTPDPASADTNKDGKVDIKDLLEVVSDWSK